MCLCVCVCVCVLCLCVCCVSVSVSLYVRGVDMIFTKCFFFWHFQELDWMLSEHVMALHAGRKK